MVRGIDPGVAAESSRLRGVTFFDAFRRAGVAFGWTQRPTGVHQVQVRVRLGAGLSRLSPSPLLTIELADGATVDDLYARIAEAEPQLAPALRSVLPVVAGSLVRRTQSLRHQDQVALLLPVSGG
jgi:molybdopterin synthase sulfur carrier subunit